MVSTRNRGVQNSSRDVSTKKNLKRKRKPNIKEDGDKAGKVIF